MARDFHVHDISAHGHEEVRLGLDARKQGARKQGLDLNARRHRMNLDARKQSPCSDARKQSLSLDARRQSPCLDARRQGLEWGIAAERHGELALDTPVSLGLNAQMRHDRLRRAEVPFCWRA